MENIVLSTAELDEHGAKEICSWRYAPPYDVYNYPDWETVAAQKWLIADPKKRREQFCAVNLENELIGYFRLTEEQDCVMLGLGIKPEYCGKGFGKPFMELVTERYKALFTEKPLRLEVREFNRRAKICYEHAGFMKTGIREKETHTGVTKFIIMEYRA